MKIILHAKVTFYVNLQNFSMDFLMMRNEKPNPRFRTFFHKDYFQMKLVAYIKNYVEFCE